MEHPINVNLNLIIVNINLNKNIRSHTGEILYKCEVCRKQLKTSRHLKRLLLVHSEDTECNSCGNQFKSRKNL